jgi:hypothetical protein
MKNLNRLAVTLLALGTVFSLTMATANAATTSIRRDSATGALYSGKVRSTLLSSNVTFSGTTPGGTNITTTCNFVRIDGTTNSDGTGTITAADVHNNTSTSCPNNLGGTTTITATGLPYTANIVYGPVTGGRDARQDVTGVKITADVVIFGIHNLCHYAGNETLNVYNKDNPNRPNPAAELQIEAKNTSISLDTSQTNGSNCPPTTITNSVNNLRGEVVANSGTFDQVLYVTP